MKIPEFTMPEPITEQTQIQMLESRIKELEYQLNSLNKFEGKPFYHKADLVHVSMGLNDEQFHDLSKIVRYWLNKYVGSGEPSRIFQEIEEAPLSLREKIYLTYKISANLVGGPGGGGCGPSIKVGSLEDFMKMIQAGLPK
jgi:hypothetical protein